MIETGNEIRKLIEAFTKNDDLQALENAIKEIEAIEEPAETSSAEHDLYRKTKLLLILEVFNAIDSKTIPDFNFDDMPDFTVAPPPETGLPSGVSLDSVKDPSLKAKFAEDIKKNQQKKDIYNFQAKIRKLDEYSTGNFEDHISIKYSRKVSDLSEIENLVNEHVISAQRRTSLYEILMTPSSPD